MGWASGCNLLSSIWTEVRELIPEGERVKTLETLMWLFEQYDCDTTSEIIYPEWPETTQAYEKLHPGYLAELQRELDSD